MIVFHSLAYEALAAEVSRIGGFARGEVEVKQFPDGERYQRVLSAVAGQDVALLGGTPTDTDALEIYDLACGLRV